MSMLICDDPSIISFNGSWGVSTKGIGDFFKPRRTFKRSSILIEAAKLLDQNISSNEAEVLLAKSDSKFWSDSNEIVGLGSLGALPVAFLVWAIGLSLGGTTGYAINPARDLGPRLMHAILPIKEKASNDTSLGFGSVAFRFFRCASASKGKQNTKAISTE